MFRAENRMLIKGKIKDAWNSPQFSFQRKLVSQNDWSFCKGARCFFDPYFDESLLLERPLIKSAIAEGKIKLDYLPPVVSIIPSYSCNNNCYMCCYASQRDREKEYKLSDDILKEIEDDIIPAAEFVTISGGEPFFSGRTRKFIERVMSARPKKRLLINTNGVLLHDFGLEKIVETDTSLNITVYGMEEASYESVTAKDYRAIVFKNVQKLLELGYQNMCLIFMVTSKNHKESERFCAFIAKNKDIKGIIRNNCFEAAKYWGLMRQLEKKYHGIAPRLKFIYQSESLINSISRRLYDPFLSMRYLRQRAKL
jgi:MoaA/NifB/PqqE/SkfB family radical SAM enzyme